MASRSNVEMKSVAVSVPQMRTVTSPLAAGARKGGSAKTAQPSHEGKKIEAIVHDGGGHWAQLGVPLSLRIACGLCGCYEPQRTMWSIFGAWRALLLSWAVVRAHNSCCRVGNGMNVCSTHSTDNTLDRPKAFTTW